jgi:hypothetical protein
MSKADNQKVELSAKQRRQRQLETGQHIAAIQHTVDVQAVGCSLLKERQISSNGCSSC